MTLFGLQTIGVLTSVTVCLCCVQVLFSKHAEEKIQQLAEATNINDETKKAALLLQSTINIINQVQNHSKLTFLMKSAITGTLCHVKNKLKKKIL